MCVALTSHYSIQDKTLLFSYHQKIIPKEGRLAAGIFYSFHGAGCYFHYKDGEIDVDFGPAGGWNGFDVFRLRQFLQTSNSLSIKYQYFLPDGVIDQEFEYLLNASRITKSLSSVGSHLYYLSETVMKNQ